MLVESLPFEQKSSKVFERNGSCTELETQDYYILMVTCQ